MDWEVAARPAELDDGGGGMFELEEESGQVSVSGLGDGRRELVVNI